MADGDPIYDREGNIVGYEGMEAEEVGITDEMGNIMIPGPATLDPDMIDTDDLVDEEALRAEAKEVSEFLAAQLKQQRSDQKGAAMAAARLRDNKAKEAASKAEVQRINKERQQEVSKLSRGQAMRKEMLDRRGKGGRRGRMFKRLSAFRIPDGSGLPGQGGQGTMFN